MLRMSLRSFGLLFLFIVFLIVSGLSYIALSYRYDQVADNRQQLQHAEIRDALDVFLAQELENLVLLAEEFIVLKELQYSSADVAFVSIENAWNKLQLYRPFISMKLINPEGQVRAVGEQAEFDEVEVAKQLQLDAQPVKKMICVPDCRLVAAIPLLLDDGFWGLYVALDISEALVIFSRLKQVNLAILTAATVKGASKRYWQDYEVPILTNSQITGTVLSQIESTSSYQSLLSSGEVVEVEGDTIEVWAERLGGESAKGTQILFFQDYTATQEDKDTRLSFAFNYTAVLLGSLLLATILATANPLRRISILATVVSFIGNKDYARAKQLMSAKNNRFLFNDEIGQVSDALYTATENLEQYEVELKSSQEHLRKLASFDQVSGLYSRYAFSQDFARIHDEEIAKNVALLLIDLDEFNALNDNLGHEAGDEILKEVGSRLAQFQNDHQMISRFGGDEFIMRVLDGVDRESLFVLAKQIQAVFKNAFFPQGLEVKISVSIGIAYANSKDSDFGKLLQRAHLAVYEAKKSSVKKFVMFDLEMEKSASLLFTVKSDFASSLLRGEFSVNFQPMLLFHNEKLLKLEALVRWKHRELGAVFPNVFIPVLEDTGQIEVLTNWMVSQAIDQLHKLDKIGLPHVSISINISGNQVSNLDYIDYLAERVRDENVDAKRIELEITETSMVEDFNIAREWVKKARTAGFKVAMDDFGTGYSSLSYLTSIPFDTVKLDRSLIKDVSTDRVQQNVIRAIISMLDDLGVDIVVEGVEEYNQFNLLKSLGCHIAQGYLISKPLDEASLGVALDNYKDKQSWFS